MDIETGGAVDDGMELYKSVDIETLSLENINVMT